MPTDSTSITVPTEMHGRIESVDAYRGIVMTLLLFGGFGIVETAANFLTLYPHNRLWVALKTSFEHSEWVGCTMWDLIEPSFFFLIGISIVLSFHARFRRVGLDREVLHHVVRRASIFVLLGILLSLVRQGPADWGLTNTLTQIGLAYAIGSLVWNQSWAIKVLCVFLILTISWVLYSLYPDAGINVATGDPSVGVSQEWAQSHLATVPAIWHKNANVGHRLDTLVLNFLPRTQPYRYDEDGYQTIIFLPSSALVVLGMLAGELLRCGWTLSAFGWQDCQRALKTSQCGRNNNQPFCRERNSTLVCSNTSRVAGDGQWRMSSRWQRFSRYDNFMRQVGHSGGSPANWTSTAAR